MGPKGRTNRQNRKNDARNKRSLREKTRKIEKTITQKRTKREGNKIPGKRTTN